MIRQSDAALRTAGSSSNSPIASEVSHLSASKPKDPAIPQQSGAGEEQSTPNCLEDSLFGAHCHDGLVMTMAVKQRLSRQYGPRKGSCLGLQELAEQESLPG